MKILVATTALAFKTPIISIAHATTHGRATRVGHSTTIIAFTSFKWIRAVLRKINKFMSIRAI